MNGLVVGLGSIGKRHLRNLRELCPDADITVLRHRPGQDDASTAELADRVVYQLDEAIDYRPDFAVVASPAPFHIDTARKLAEQRCHLMLEKPISDKLDGVVELMATCERHDLTLLVGYTLRFSPFLRQVKALVDEGQVGGLIGFQSQVGQYLPDWRKGASYKTTVSARKELGGGVLLELSHELDCARWLVGEVDRLSALAGQVSALDLDVEDWAELTLHFDSGAIGHVHMDMVQRAPIRGCRVIGTDGTIAWESDRRRVMMYSSDRGEWSDRTPQGEAASCDMYIEEMKHFIACVRGEASPAVTGEDGKRALELALAARKSSDSGRVVEL